MLTWQLGCVRGTLELSFLVGWTRASCVTAALVIDSAWADSQDVLAHVAVARSAVQGHPVDELLEGAVERRLTISWGRASIQSSSSAGSSAFVNRLMSRSQRRWLRKGELRSPSGVGQRDDRPWARCLETLSRDLSPTPLIQAELSRTPWIKQARIDRKRLVRANSQSGCRGSNPVAVPGVRAQGVSPRAIHAAPMQPSKRGSAERVSR
jgi:hypothetical protein